LFVGVTSVLLCLPLLLPVAVSVVAGDAVAGEASSGTLRYLLLAPVGRARLLTVKLVVCLMWAATAVAAPALVGAVVGRVVFGADPAPLLSGDSVGAGEALLRLLLVVAYVTVAMWGLVGVGLAASTFTDAPLAAGATAMILAVVSQILAQVPQLDHLHPWLFTATWFDVGDLLRTPVHLESFTHHALLQAAWLVVLVPVAWARLSSRDVTS
jgi:ABC-2 type transport system permease protein